MKKSIPLIGKWLIKDPNAVRTKSLVDRERPKKAHEDSDDPISLSEPISKDKDGVLTFKDGQFFITDPSGQGIYPSLVIPAGVDIKLFIDGAQLEGKSAIVTSSSHVSFETPYQEPNVGISCSVDRDRLSVTMRVELIDGKRYLLRPFEEMTKAIVQLDEAAEVATPPSYEHLMEHLKNEGFVGVIDEQAIRVLSTTRSTAERTVLRGIEPIPAAPDEFRALPLPEEYDPFVGQRVPQTVRMGSVIAVIDEGSPAVVGTDVFGKVIQARREIHPTLTFGPGTQRIDNKAVATRAGRVVVGKYKVDVLPQMVITHDVSPKDGYVSFDGDIVVHGSILDGSKVNARGILKVAGSIMGATVVGEQGVIVKENVIKSQVSAGWAQQVFKDIAPLTQRILLELKRLNADIRRVLLHMQTKQLSNQVKSNVVGAVTTQYYTNLLENLAKLAALYHINSAAYEVDAEMSTIGQLIQSKWTDSYVKNLTVADVEELLNLLVRHLKQVETSISEDVADFKASSITSSNVQCSGSAFITGLGTYSSSLEAGGTIEVSGSVRGGFLTARNSVKIYELGSQAGAETSVKVLDSAGAIRVNVRYPNTLLEVDGKRDRNLLREERVTFRQTKESDCMNSL